MVDYQYQLIVGAPKFLGFQKELLVLPYYFFFSSKSKKHFEGLENIFQIFRTSTLSSILRASFGVYLDFERTTKQISLHS